MAQVRLAAHSFEEVLGLSGLPHLSLERNWDLYAKVCLCFAPFNRPRLPPASKPTARHATLGEGSILSLRSTTRAGKKPRDTWALVNEPGEFLPLNVMGFALTGLLSG